MLKLDHLTPKALATWADLASCHQLRIAYHLATECSTCWSTIESLTGEPMATTDPLLRAAFRIVGRPRVDLSLASESLYLLTEPCFRRGEGFARLLLEESIALGQESMNPALIELPEKLSELLGSTMEPGRRRDLQVRLECARAKFCLQKGDDSGAEKAVELARSLVSEGTSDPAVRVHVKMADYLRATYRGEAALVVKTMVAATNETFTVLVDRPVQRFEILLEVVRHMNRIEPGKEEPADIAWAMAELAKGPWGPEPHRLNGLFHKARFATIAEAFQPSALPIIADELEAAFADIKVYGDRYSQGLFYQLLGALLGNLSFIRSALDLYSGLRLERAFTEALRSARPLLGKGTRAQRAAFSTEVPKMALLFGKPRTREMVRGVLEVLIP